MDTIQYQLKFKSYKDLLIDVETSFLKYKQMLLDNNIYLYHPSSIPHVSTSEFLKIEELFPKESKIFENSKHFYFTLIKVNYLLGSLNQIMDLNYDEKDVQSISISIEDLLILETFKKI